MADQVFASVLEIVTRVAGPGRTPEQPAPDTPLAGGFWLDSVELLDVIVACEDTFLIAFDGEDDLRVGRFATLGALADAVRDKLAKVER